MKKIGQLEGGADTMLFRERELFSTTLELLEKDIDLFSNDRPIPSDWY